MIFGISVKKLIKAVLHNHHLLQYNSLPYWVPLIKYQYGPFKKFRQARHQYLLGNAKQFLCFACICRTAYIYTTPIQLKYA